MKCPACKDPILIMSERMSIEIDYCPECRGVWLDHGELDKIIERSNSESLNYNGKYKDTKFEGYKTNHRKEKHKKKSFFSELFDF